MEEKKKDDLRVIDRSCGILLGVMGVLGVLVPFTKKPQRDALIMSIWGIGLINTLYTVIAQSTRS